MSFRYYGSLKPNGGEMLIGGDTNDGLNGATIIDNSTEVTIGDVVKIDSNGNLELAGAGDSVFGILVAVEQNGVSIDPDSGTTNTYTVASDNETVGKVYGIVDVSQSSLWSANQDGTAGTTANSNQIGAYIDIADEATLDEDTASRTRSTGGQFTTFGADINDSTRLIVAINESQLISGT